MFTGIIECTGKIESIENNGTNKTFEISCAIANELKVDQSINHDGVCLTVQEIVNESYRVTAIKETLSKANLEQWKTGDEVNIERCILMNGRLDGHVVQGHIDATALCIERKELEGSHEYRFEYPKEFSHLIIEKGSVCVNGISLTAFKIGKQNFSVAIIPYTFHHTNIKNIKPGSLVNIEFDVIGKYLARFKEVIL
ncbi:MAG: riboflavin synthase [Parafilimonas sp.]